MKVTGSCYFVDLKKKKVLPYTPNENIEQLENVPGFGGVRFLYEEKESESERGWMLYSETYNEELFGYVLTKSKPFYRSAIIVEYVSNIDGVISVCGVDDETMKIMERVEFE